MPHASKLLLPQRLIEVQIKLTNKNIEAISSAWDVVSCSAGDVHSTCVSGHSKRLVEQWSAKLCRCNRVEVPVQLQHICVNASNIRLSWQCSGCRASHEDS